MIKGIVHALVEERVFQLGSSARSNVGEVFSPKIPHIEIACGHFHPRSCIPEPAAFFPMRAIFRNTVHVASRRADRQHVQAIDLLVGTFEESRHGDIIRGDQGLQCGFIRFANKAGEFREAEGMISETGHPGFLAAAAAGVFVALDADQRGRISRMVQLSLRREAFRHAYNELGSSRLLDLEERVGRHIDAKIKDPVSRCVLGNPNGLERFLGADRIDRLGEHTRRNAIAGELNRRPSFSYGLRFGPIRDYPAGIMDLAGIHIAIHHRAVLPQP